MGFGVQESRCKKSSGIDRGHPRAPLLAGNLDIWVLLSHLVSDQLVHNSYWPRPLLLI